MGGGALADGHIFVSYSSVDRAFAEDLVRQLEAGGNRIWYAPRDVRPGIDYSEQIQAAIEQARAFIIIISEASNESDFVRAETEMAFSRRRPIFPVRRALVAPAPGLALFLQLRHWTDAFGPARHNAVARLNGELVDLGRSGGKSRKRGSRFRPAPLPSGGGRTARTGAIVALGVTGCGALLACILLLTQTDNKASAGATVPGAGSAAANGVAPLASDRQADMTPLVETWLRYIQDTAPPPPIEENLLPDNAMPVDSNAAAPATNDAGSAPAANTVGM